MHSTVSLTKGIEIGNDLPFVLMGGMNVLESAELADEVCAAFKDVTDTLGIPFVFKASFDKANRSSIKSFRGPGLEAGLALLADLKSKYGVPVITDVHEPGQAAEVAEVADIVQLPAFLARQTDLVVALAETGRVVNVKKPQFLAPDEMTNIIAKCSDAGNDRVLLCERGSCFGYNNLIVDMLGVDRMKRYAPVVFDVTHALQRPGGQGTQAGGRREQVVALTRSGMAVGLAGLFLEAHPNPSDAKCDGPSALPLTALRPFLEQVKRVDDLVKGFAPIDTSGSAHGD